MQFNRNHFLLIGLILLLLGCQLRFVDTFILSESSTRFLAQKTGKTTSPMPSWTIPAVMNPEPTIPVARRKVKPPQWLGWTLISVGAILVMQSLVMKKPG